MPTTLVSFLGTGQKSDPKNSRSGYRKATYRFSAQGGADPLIETTLFGTALVSFLLQKGTPVDRWIVLGTSASLWSELNQILPDHDSVLEDYFRIDDRVAAKTVDNHALNQWQQALQSHGAPVDLRLCLTGEALDPMSQRQIAMALFEHVPRGNDLVFDITHGFRHQPVIATFLVSLMRWTHSIQKISFYSGVFEARTNDITPVLELPICQELVDATEAAAILDVTGNYEAVATHLGLNASIPWFLENTNQLANARNPAKQLAIQLDRIEDVVRAEMAKLLKDRLQWSNQGTFAERFAESARKALDQSDYFRAVVLSYEALLIRSGQLLFPSTDPLDYENRIAGEEELFPRLRGNDLQILKALQWTRNACAHGTRPDRADTQKVLRAPDEFRSLIQKALDLFDRLPSILT